MRVRFLEADDVRIRFEAACTRLGEGEARRAFSMALNKEGRKSFTQLRRSLPSSHPSRAARSRCDTFQSATRATMSTVTSGTGRHLPLVLLRREAVLLRCACEDLGQGADLPFGLRGEALRRRRVQAHRQGALSDRAAVGSVRAEGNAARRSLCRMAGAAPARPHGVSRLIALMLSGAGLGQAGGERSP